MIVGGGLKLSINHWMPLALGSVCKSVCVCGECMCVCVLVNRWLENERLAGAVKDFVTSESANELMLLMSNLT